VLAQATTVAQATVNASSKVVIAVYAIRSLSIDRIQ
jgi:hypothetical protein